MELGKAMRIKRQTKGYSQEYVGSLLGLDQTSISRIERGETDPTFGQFFHYTRVVECQLRDFEGCHPPPLRTPKA